MFWFKLVVTAISWVWLEFSTFDSYTSYFKESNLPLPSHKIIPPLSLKSYLILKVHGWYVFGIKLRMNMVLTSCFQEFNILSKRSFSVVLAAVFVYTCDILKTSSFVFYHMWLKRGKKKKKAITSMCVLSKCWWLKRGFGVEALI